MKANIATVKSFIRKNPDAKIRVKADFDDMVDGVRYNPNAQWHPLTPALHPHDNNMGLSGVWFVGRSRDFVQPYSKDGMSGFEVSNSCGCWAVAK